MIPKFMTLEIEWIVMPFMKDDQFGVREMGSRRGTNENAMSLAHHLSVWNISPDN